MNKLQANALRIAELMKFIDNRYCGVKRELLIKEFSSYNGLMPILFECNSGISFGITIRPNGIMLYDYGEEKYYFDCKYQKEAEFIEALQLACIKYLELKNEK